MMAWLARRPGSLFATASLAGHLLRGVAAFGLLYGAVTQQQAHPVAAVLAGLGALVAMRGCPVCWAIGLLETITSARRGPSRPGD